VPSEERAAQAYVNPEPPRPKIERAASTRRKKAQSSRLSFGPGEIISGDAAEALEDEMFSLKKEPFGRRVIESNALRRSLAGLQLPRRDEDEQRPTYSKDYLDELKGSTPSTPRDLAGLSMVVDDDLGLDPSELEGAMIVDSDDLPGAAHIPTEAEIREKKERRARLAKEEDFISLHDDGSSRQEVSLLPRKPKAETRLVRDDEDIAEGFDEFVDDGRISLGKKAEREAKKRQRAAIADMIQEAEGSSSDDSDDSEKERMAAFESAQTRAAMDGLAKPEVSTALHEVPPKITPLPKLDDCLQRLQATLRDMQQDLSRSTAKMAQLQQEKAEIIAREQEVQVLLKQAGDRYAAMRAEIGLPAVDTKVLLETQDGSTAPQLGGRGLESFGNTPVGRPPIDDVG
jgi:hypothetical protein